MDEAYRSLKLALIGKASSLTEELVHQLVAHNFPHKHLTWYTLNEPSADTFEEPLSVDDIELSPHPLTDSAFADADLAFFCTNEATAATYVPKALRANCLVIDTSRAFRLHPQSCLLVPDASLDPLVFHKGLISIPNNLTIPLLTTLTPLHEEVGITRCIVTALLSVSSAGKAGISELEKQVGDLLNMRDISVDVFPHQIAFNLLPQTSAFDTQASVPDYTRDEIDLQKETQRLFEDEDIGVTATCVHVPVFFCHALSVTLETKKHIDAKVCRTLLVDHPAIHVVDNPRESLYPTVIDCGGEDAVFVGRIREDTSCENGLNLWIVCDNLCKGQAAACVQTAEALLRQNMLHVTPTLLDQA